MTTLSFTEGRHAAEFIISEANGHLSRENATISGSKVLPGQVLGLTTPAGGATDAAVGTTVGTGAGVMTLASPKTAVNAKEGVWNVVFIEPVSGLGTFEVLDPDGQLDGTGFVGTAYTGGIKFTIADGTPDFLSGDRIPVTVTRTDAATKPVYKALNLVGTDGSQIAAAIALSLYDAASADVVGVVIDKHAEVNGNTLTWPAGITTAQKEAAITQLAKKRIAVR